MPRASIIVIEHNTVRHLPHCLASLEKLQFHPEEVEVVVVDNDSPTPAAPLRERFGSVRFLHTGRNLGFAGACNWAVPRTSGDVLVLLNPDARVTPGWLHNLLAPLSDPQVGVVGCKVYYPSSRVIQHAGGLVFDNGLTEHVGRGELEGGQYEQERDVTYVTGASLAIPRRLVDELGGLFSDVYFPAYYEETELCDRVREAGYRVVYTPRAVLYHAEAVASGGGSSARFWRYYHTNRIRYLLRNRSAGQLLREALPAELEFLMDPGRSDVERRICLRAYVDALRSYGGARRRGSAS
jgi:GT2 family glycosyltransferase